MRRRLRSINLIRLFFLLVLLASLALILVFAFSWSQAVLLSVKEKASETVYSEDITLVFSSSKPYYTLGETAVFYIDILNLREFPISKVDFSLKVKALSLFGLNIISIEDYSTRTFKPGKLERIIVERSLPAFIPPGFFTLELSARPSILKSPPKASITICLKPSTSSMTTPLTVLIFSCAISIGQKFVFLGICVLMIAALQLIFALETFANDLAALAYFSLTIGAINLIWETSKRKTTFLKFHLPTRLILSLTILGLLTYVSNMILAMVIFGFTFYMAIYAKLKR